jgi:hypothetical protein
MTHDPGLASSWHPLLFKEGKLELGSRPSSPKNPHAHAPEAGPCRPETCFSQAMKIVHFGPILAVRILGRICSEKVVHPGKYYVALQLMTLRFALCSLCLSN